MARQKDTLVSLLPEIADLARARDLRWYRIPAKIKRVPRLVAEGGLRWIAFYQGKKFGNECYSIRQVAAVIDVTQVRRSELLSPPSIDSPDYESYFRKAEDLYYKISLGPLTQLPRPVMNKAKWRRIVFIETLLDKLLVAEELNDLFQTSAAEEKMWEALKASGISAEREYHVPVRTEHFFLDFAIFCRKGRIDLECDGGYHDEPMQIAEDKDRNNLLQSAGWSVLRFSPDDILYHTERTVSIVRETVKQYGGVG
jgi:very-short-patch-repair endonuclease